MSDIRPIPQSRETETEPAKKDGFASVIHKAGFYHHANLKLELVTIDAQALNYPQHSHISVYTAGLVTGGQISLEKNNTVSRLKAGSTFHVPPYLPHKIWASGPCRLMSLCLDKGLTGKQNLKTVMEFLKKLEERNIVSAGHSRALLQLAALIGDDRHEVKDVDQRLDRVRRFLESAPSEEFPITAMAAEAGLSKFHFIRSFQAEFGLTPHKFQIQNRFRQAKKACLHSASLTEAGLAAGFFDQSHFIKCFKRMTGLKPNDFKGANFIINGS